MTNRHVGRPSACGHFSRKGRDAALSPWDSSWRTEHFGPKKDLLEIWSSDEETIPVVEDPAIADPDGAQALEEGSSSSEAQVLEEETSQGDNDGEETFRQRADRLQEVWQVAPDLITVQRV